MMIILVVVPHSYSPIFGINGLVFAIGFWCLCVGDCPTRPHHLSLLLNRYFYLQTVHLLTDRSVLFDLSSPDPLSKGHTRNK